MDLCAALNGEREGQPPAILGRADGPCLLYRGKLHAVHGEPEAGKGWLLMQAVADELARSNYVAYIDFEDDDATAVERLRALGVDPECIRERFRYLRPDEPLGREAGPRRTDLARAFEPAPSLVVIDGITEALAIEGLSLMDNADYAKWLHCLPAWVRDQTGAAVVLIDHVTKDREARGKWAIGAQHKLAGIDVAYGVRLIESFARGVSGRGELRLAKDRPGWVRPHAEDGVVAELSFVSDDGRMAVSILPPDPEGWRPTDRMEEVSRAVEAEPGLSVREVRQRVAGKAEITDQAIDLLRRDGYMRTQKDGPAKRHYSVRPYRRAAEENPRPGAPVSPPRPAVRDTVGGGGTANRVPVSPPLGDTGRGSRPPSRSDAPLTSAESRLWDTDSGLEPTEGDDPPDTLPWDYTDGLRYDDEAWER